MDLARGFLFIWILSILFLHHYSGNVNARYHYHKKQKEKDTNKGSPVSTSPVYAFDLQEPVPSSPIDAPASQDLVPLAPADPPSNPPSIPSDPYPNELGDTSDYIFDVTSIGAVGDGFSDDTVAFREAWKVAFAVEFATILAPSDKVFIITSTIFSGPCKPGLIFQVRI